MSELLPYSKARGSKSGCDRPGRQLGILGKVLFLYIGLRIG